MNRASPSRAARAAMVFTMLALLTGCGRITADKADAARGMDRFHDQYNESQFEKIYDTADPGFQRVNPRADFLRSLQAVHRQLGAYQSCENKNWHVNYDGAGTVVTLHYKTTFAKGTGDETFFFLMAGTKPALRDYKIDSPTLTAE